MTPSLMLSTLLVGSSEELTHPLKKLLQVQCVAFQRRRLLPSTPTFVLYPSAMLKKNRMEAILKHFQFLPVLRCIGNAKIPNCFVKQISCLLTIVTLSSRLSVSILQCQCCYRQSRDPFAKIEGAEKKTSPTIPIISPFFAYI